MQLLSRQVLPRQVSPRRCLCRLMVAVDDGRHAAARVRLAADLAHRFGARLIGAAGCLPEYPPGFGEGDHRAARHMAIEEIRQAALTGSRGPSGYFGRRPA